MVIAKTCIMHLRRRIAARRTLGSRLWTVGPLEVTRIHGNFQDGETGCFNVDGKEKTLVVSKVFDNEDFGFHKITVERPLRLDFQASAERIARLDGESGFAKLATSTKKDEAQRLAEIEAGERRQQAIRDFLRDFTVEARSACIPTARTSVPPCSCSASSGASCSRRRR